MFVNLRKLYKFLEHPEDFEIFPDDKKHLLGAKNLKLEYPDTSGAHIEIYNGNLFVSTRFNNFICIFDLESMEVVQYESTRGETPRQFTIHDNILVVANQDSHNLIFFNIAENGRLRFKGEVKGIDAPAWVEFIK